MGTAKLVEKLEKFFTLSERKRRKKHDKLLKIIEKLEKKKSSLVKKAEREKSSDASSRRRHALDRELKVISKLVSRAKQKSLID